jgi:hypothetical protein
MLTLICFVVGVKGNAFPVTIDVKRYLGDLKDAIKQKKENNFKEVDADKLELLLTKNINGLGLNQTRMM